MHTPTRPAARPTHDHRQLTLAIYDRAWGGEVRAQCLGCAGSWLMKRGEAFRCPHCSATLAAAAFEPTTEPAT